MRVEVLFPGPARDAAGVEQLELALPDQSLASDVRSMLMERNDRLAALLPASRLAVNNAFAREDQPLRDGDVVAVIAPVSGG